MSAKNDVRGHSATIRVNAWAVTHYSVTGGTKNSYAGKMEVQEAYRSFKRDDGVFYIHHNATGRQTSLRTKDPKEAARLITAKNHAANEPLLNLALGKACLSAIDPQCSTRTWKDVFTYLAERGKDTSRERWQRVTRMAELADALDSSFIQQLGPIWTHVYLRALLHIASETTGLKKTVRARFFDLRNTIRRVINLFSRSPEAGRSISFRHERRYAPRLSFLRVTTEWAAPIALIDSWAWRTISSSCNTAAS